MGYGNETFLKVTLRASALEYNLERSFGNNWIRLERIRGKLRDRTLKIASSFESWKQFRVHKSRSPDVQSLLSEYEYGKWP